MSGAIDNAAVTAAVRRLGRIIGDDAGFWTDVMGGFGCTEIEVFADVFRAAGLRHIGELIVNEHAFSDEPGDAHYGVESQ